MTKGMLTNRNNQMTVPQFGGWDGHQAGDETNYSVVFSQACENRRKHRKEPMSLGSERELHTPPQHYHGSNRPRAQDAVHSSWMGVPKFGGWDGKAADETNYSEVFTQARESRKKHKREPMSLGNEREFLTSMQHFHGTNPHTHAGVQRMHEKKKKKMKRSMTCFTCFTGMG